MEVAKEPMGYSWDEFIASDSWRERIHAHADQFIDEWGGEWAELLHDLAEATIAEFLSDFDMGGGAGLEITLNEAAHLIGLRRDGEWR